MRPSHFKSYNPAYELNSAIINGGIATVLKSDNPNFKAGDQIVNLFQIPTTEYAALPREVVDSATVIVNPYNLDVKYFLGPLGMPGLTAYSSFYNIGAPKKGDTIFISSAAGPVGQLVGQLAKNEGLTVIGSVGGNAKLGFITKDLKFDAGFNYKKEKPLDALKRLAPDGVNIYYDNFGGEQLEAAITCMNNFGRIVACGMISHNLRPGNLAVQPTPGEPIPDPQPHADHFQTPDDAWLHRRRRQHGPALRRRAPAEGPGMARRWHLQGHCGRHQGH